MGGMRVDHVSYAAEHDGLHATAERLAKLIGVTPVDGGVHPRFGTRNVILPLSKPALMVVGLFQFMATWNDFMGPNAPRMDFVITLCDTPQGQICPDRAVEEYLGSLS